MTALSRDEWLAGEWLEADGLGGFASGTVGGARARRYHALLLAATTPPTGRMVLVNGLEVWLETPAGRFALSSQRYAPDVVHPDGAAAAGRVPRRALAAVDLPLRGRHRGHPGGDRLPRARRRRGALAPALAARRGAPERPAAALGPRLPRPAPREPGLRLRRRRRPARACSGGPIRACRRSRRSATAAIGTTRSGTATSSIRRSSRAASTATRISPRPASSPGR